MHTPFEIHSDLRSYNNPDSIENATGDTVAVVGVIVLPAVLLFVKVADV